MDVPVHKKAIAALRCFRRAVEIEDASGKLWMEYGALSYQLHSHASRQLKYHQVCVGFLSPLKHSDT